MREIQNGTKKFESLKVLPAMENKVGSQSSTFIIWLATLEAFVSFGLHKKAAPRTPPSQSVSLTFVGRNVKRSE